MRDMSLKSKLLRWGLIIKFVGCLFVMFLFPADGFPVNFSINPIRIFFDGGKKTDILTIKNESQKNIALQLDAFAWTQEGEDNVYAPTEDILFFPKLVEINPSEEKIIRIGTKVSRGGAEKTYRLFIEEMPDNSRMETTAVKIIMKVGVPVFIAPLSDDASGFIDKVELNKGKLRIDVKNDGNIHFVIKSIKVAGKDGPGKEMYNSEKAGGYLHHGKSKEFAFEVPEDACRTIKALYVHIDTDRLEMGKEIEITGEMCRP